MLPDVSLPPSSSGGDADRARAGERGTEMTAGDRPRGCAASLPSRRWPRLTLRLWLRLRLRASRSCSSSTAVDERCDGAPRSEPYWGAVPWENCWWWPWGSGAEWL